MGAKLVNCTYNGSTTIVPAEWRDGVLDGAADKLSGRHPKMDISDHGPDTFYADGYSCGYFTPKAYTFSELER